MNEIFTLRMKVFLLLFQVKTCDVLYQKAIEQADLEVISEDVATINK